MGHRSKHVNICLKCSFKQNSLKQKKGGKAHLEKHANKTTRFSHSIFWVDRSHKIIDRAHSNAMQGLVFKSDLLSCIWISEFLRWRYCYFEQNLSTVTLLMPPWCVIHSVSKPPVRLFIPLNHGHCSFIIESWVWMCKKVGTKMYISIT